ncbi:MAG: alpha/beta hydrolase [Fimbriimonas ginsengisoli]|uniref:Alpha/beta hydrolase n=1 Tax=Fimbriimonas ginsengisoli TaxID=1005039 RepID=A0A931LRD4_FIMGI|nr:alpha/beta hydrolase [Fimbriimonas ginsengisoli]
MTRPAAAIAIAVLSSVALAQVLHRPGIDLPYKVIGKGKPVLLLSGGPGFTTDYEMGLVKGSRTKGIQWILLEQRGTPRARLKNPSEKTLSLANYVADLEALRNQLHLKRWTVVGHSWGSVLAHEYTAHHPNRVHGLLLLGDVGPDASMLNPAGDNTDRMLNKEEREAEAKAGGDVTKGPADDDAGLALFLVQLPGCFYSRDNADKSRSMFAKGCLVADTENYVLPALLKNKWNVSKAMRRYKGQVMVIQGRQDMLGETPLWKDVLAMPQCQGFFIERSGHMPWLEQPQAFFKPFDAFLREIK